jgi:hypothetical protein
MLNLNKNINIDQFSDEIFMKFNLNNFFKIDYLAVYFFIIIYGDFVFKLSFTINDIN